MRISAIVLAAGRSSRMAGGNKLLLPWDGSTVIRHVADTVLELHLSETILVLGHDLQKIESATCRLPVLYTINQDYALGMGSSIARGVFAASPESEGFLICLGDMPRVSVSLLSAIVSGGAPDGITYPTLTGEQRNPVLFGCKFRESLLNLHGDQGARSVIRDNLDACVGIEWHDASCFQDIDTRDAIS